MLRLTVPQMFAVQESEDGEQRGGIVDGVDADKPVVVATAADK